MNLFYDYIQCGRCNVESQSMRKNMLFAFRGSWQKITHRLYTIDVDLCANCIGKFNEEWMIKFQGNLLTCKQQTIEKKRGEEEKISSTN